MQGLLWEDGYRSGELRGQVYPDAPDARHGAGFGSYGQVANAVVSVTGRE